MNSKIFIIHKKVLSLHIVLPTTVNNRDNKDYTVNDAIHRAHKDRKCAVCHECRPLITIGGNGIEEIVAKTNFKIKVYRI